jgi:adenylosuccinate synthase
MKKKKYLAVIDLGFGDAGKGITTDYLCSQNPNSLVIRYSGGPQAGHTVCCNGMRHVFASFGSGTFRKVPTYISKYCVIDPIAILNEYTVLLKKDLSPVLYIDERCPVVTPHDSFHTATDTTFKENGTCGVGIGATYKREQDLYSLTFHDIFYPTILEIKLKQIEKYYYGAKESFYIEPDLNVFFESCKKLRGTLLEDSFVKKCYGIPEIPKCNTYIFEGSQGLLLDQNIGFFPHVTWGNTGSKNIVELCGTEDIEFYLVTRAYQTRHGNGPMTNEDIPHNIQDNPNETNKLHMHQGVFRKSLLDLNLIHYGMSKDSVIYHAKKKTLVITCLDHIKNSKVLFEDTYRFVVADSVCRSYNENEFIGKISKILEIPDVLVSSSDESKNIKKLHFK